MPASASSCSTTCPPAMTGRSPQGVPLVVGDSGDQELVGRLLREHAHRCDHPFRGIDRGSGFGARSARLLPQQHRQYPRADRMRGEGRHSPFYFFLDRRGLRQSGGNSGDGKCADAADLALWLVEADERSHAARCRPRAWSRSRHPALLQRRRRRSALPHRAIDQGGDASDQGRRRSRARLARRSSTSSATIIRRPTARAFATIFTSAISRARIPMRCVICAPARRR